VTNRGGRTCHAAIISRELGIPCVVVRPHCRTWQMTLDQGCGNATEILGREKQGSEVVTVDCSGGEVGRVWEGKLEYETDIIDASRLPKLRTKICMNLADPTSVRITSRLATRSFLTMDLL
jgi:pyruvate,water dikinase